MRRPGRRAVLAMLLAALAAVGCAQSDTWSGPGTAPTPWVSRAVPEARGDFTTFPDGRRQAIRYPGWITDDFGTYRTYAYGDSRPEVAPAKVAMPRVTADPTKGRSVFLSRNLGPCTGCHLVQGADVWPAGNVGPDLSTYGDRRLPDEYVFNMIYDPRHIFPNTTMPPWGAAGVFTPEDIVHVVAFLQTQKGPLPPEANPERNPETRPKPVGFGDNLDPTNNPGVIRAESAEARWSRKAPSGRSCAECHPGGPLQAMKGVATRYPKYAARFGRVISIEDFLTVHSPETMAVPMPAESADNLDMTVLVKMASNGMPVSLDLLDPDTAAALERGKHSFHKRVGQRNHACADCHTAGKGADKFLGGRLLANVEVGLTRHFPTWRTSQSDIWDMRKRMQWCMTPLGTNMLTADAVEYAELELYLASFDQGKPMNVPGIRH